MTTTPSSTLTTFQSIEISNDIESKSTTRSINVITPIDSTSTSLLSTKNDKFLHKTSESAVAGTSKRKGDATTEGKKESKKKKIEFLSGKFNLFEQLQFWEGVRVLGWGNWNDIARYYVCTRSTRQLTLCAKYPRKLPSPWQEHADPKTGRVYFYNPVAKISQWTYPLDHIWEGLENVIGADKIRDVKRAFETKELEIRQAPTEKEERKRFWEKLANEACHESKEQMKVLYEELEEKKSEKVSSKCRPEKVSSKRRPEKVSSKRSHEHTCSTDGCKNKAYVEGGKCLKHGGTYKKPSAKKTTKNNNEIANELAKGLSPTQKKLVASVLCCLDKDGKVKGAPNSKKESYSDEYKHTLEQYTHALEKLQDSLKQLDHIKIGLLIRKMLLPQKDIRHFVTHDNVLQTIQKGVHGRLVEKKKVIVLTNKRPWQGELTPRSPKESDEILIDVYVKTGIPRIDAERMVAEARNEMNQESQN